jgi:hypothetical protein
MTAGGVQIAARPYSLSTTHAWWNPPRLLRGIGVSRGALLVRVSERRPRTPELVQQIAERRLQLFLL